jgi:hypothetical protein
MFCQKNFFTASEVIDAKSFASIHLVEYSIVTTANLLPLARVAESQQGPHLIFGVAISEVSFVSLPKVFLEVVKSFDRPHMFW